MPLDPPCARQTLGWMLRRRPLAARDERELARRLGRCFDRGGASAVVAVLRAALSLEGRGGPSAALARGAARALLRLGVPHEADELLPAVRAGLQREGGGEAGELLGRLLRVRSLLRAARIGRSCLVAVVGELEGIECDGTLRRAAVALERLTGVSFEVAELLVSELAAGECDCELAMGTWLRW